MRCGMFLVFWESPEWYNYIFKRRPQQKCRPLDHSALEVERCFHTKSNQWAITLKVFSIRKKYSKIKKIGNFLGAMQFGSPVHCGWPSSSINFNLTISWKRILTLPLTKVQNVWKTKYLQKSSQYGDGPLHWQLVIGNCYIAACVNHSFLIADILVQSMMKYIC